MCSNYDATTGESLCPQKDARFFAWVDSTQSATYSTVNFDLYIGQTQPWDLWTNIENLDIAGEQVGVIPNGFNSEYAIDFLSFRLVEDNNGLTFVDNPTQFVALYDPLTDPHQYIANIYSAVPLNQYST